MLEPRTYSLVDYREAETVAEDYRALARRAGELYAAIPADARDAFYQLVLYPVKASAVVNDLYVTVGLNRLYAVQGRASTNELADRARALFREDEALAREYNETLAGGKWRHMMDQTRIGYTYWNQPVRNAMPGVQEVQVPPPAEMGLAVEGSEASWPGGPGEPATPALSVFDGQPRYIEIFNRGSEPFDFSIAADEPWLAADPPRGTVGRDHRIQVSADWARVPVGTERGTLTVSGPGGAAIRVAVPILNPPAPRPETLDGYVEAHGHVSMEAEHFTRAVAPAGREWLVIPGHGRTLSGVAAMPVTAPPIPPAAGVGMRLEYRMHLFSAGEAGVEVHLAPTQKFQPGGGFRYAISFDDEAPQVINVHADESLGAWEKSVADGVKTLTTRLAIAKPGAHVLKFWAVDPGLVVQKIVVHTGRPRPSYLGPPESARGAHPSRSP